MNLFHLLTAILISSGNNNSTRPAFSLYPRVQLKKHTHAAAASIVCTNSHPSKLASPQFHDLRSVKSLSLFLSVPSDIIARCLARDSIFIGTYNYTYSRKEDEKMPSFFSSRGIYIYSSRVCIFLYTRPFFSLP